MSPKQPSRATVSDAAKHQKRAFLGRAAVFAFLLMAFYGVINTPTPLIENSLANGVTLRPYLQRVATGCGAILSAIGHTASVQENSIVSDRFSMRIVRGCDATEPLALLTIAILASPARFRWKLAGILLGCTALLTFNLIRLVTLFLVGSYMPTFFDMMHKEVLQAVLIVATVAIWAAWYGFVKHRESKASHARA